MLIESHLLVVCKECKSSIEKRCREHSYGGIARKGYQPMNCNPAVWTGKYLKHTFKSLTTENHGFPLVPFKELSLGRS